MNIQGLAKVTLLDYPDKVACTIFTLGCNFRCPYCHNASLVMPEHITSESYSEQDILSFLKRRVGILDGVCISGGEPLLQHDIADFIRKVKALGFDVKLDTNGSMPDRLISLVEEGLIDYVAMDIKSAPSHYGSACGLNAPPLDAVQRSVDFLLSGAVPFEFRTTVVDELHDEKHMASIAEWISGAKQYFIQNYTDSDNVLEEGLHACSVQKLQTLLQTVTARIPTARLRGI